MARGHPRVAGAPSLTPALSERRSCIDWKEEP